MPEAFKQDLAGLIKRTASRVRSRDYLWTVGISGGVAIATTVSGVGDWRIVTIAWLAFLAALAVRYRYSTGRLWADPIQRIVETELSAQQAELITLRTAAGVARALPEPLFILDTDGVIEHANPAAQDLVGVKGLEGRHLAAVLRAPDVVDAADDVLQKADTRTVEFITTGSVERACEAFVTVINIGAEQRVLVFVKDLTTERRLEQMRADFIASASHELRTPLSSVIGFIETLRGPAQGDPEATEKFLTIMQAQAERMQRLVSDLMSLSRIELNEHVPPSDIIDLADVAGDVADSLAPLFEQAGAIVDVIIEEDAATTIRGAHDEVFQAIQNLLDNAVKYGGDPAMVKLRVGRGAAPALTEDGDPGHRAGDSSAQTAARSGVDVSDLVYFQVRDFGPGVERADLPRLTERFYRVNLERSRKTGGTGLGLAIVKHVVNRHKGGFQIESRLAGGTAFTCYFVHAPTRNGASHER